MIPAKSATNSQRVRLTYIPTEFIIYSHFISVYFYLVPLHVLSKDMLVLHKVELQHMLLSVVVFVRIIVTKRLPTARGCLLWTNVGGILWHLVCITYFVFFMMTKCAKGAWADVGCSWPVHSYDQCRPNDLLHTWDLPIAHSSVGTSMHCHFSLFLFLLQNAHWSIELWSVMEH